MDWGEIMKTFMLPEDFLLGTATASLQIEGGDKNNSWYRWAEKGHIKDGSHCIIADDHWNLLLKDIDLMKKLNCHTYRMSLEWSRIEPGRGKFNQDAMDRYRWEIKKLIENGIKPLVTLHHFSNPLWFEDEKGWLNPEADEYFEKYTEYVASNLGDLVSDWITINEPNVYLMFGYIKGIWPPGKKNTISYFMGAKNMIIAHIKAYKRIHEIRYRMGYRDTMVGASHHLRIFDPKNGKKSEKWVCKNYEKIFQDIFLEGMGKGKLTGPVGSGYPMGMGRFMDFLGVNYYSRDIISLSPNPAALFGKLGVMEGAKINDLGWEIYPEGLYRVCKKYYEQYKVPVYITENGTCDSRDEFRAEYIYDHLYQVKRLIDDGVDVRRYYHWTLMDNFEWLEGLSARFGLYEVNYENLERSLRKSGEFYGMLCKNRGVTENMIEKNLKTHRAYNKTEE